MQKRLVLPVDVGYEVLARLGQVQDGPEIDDLRAGCLDRGILTGQHFEIAELLRGKGFMAAHVSSSLRGKRRPERTRMLPAVIHSAYYKNIPCGGGFQHEKWVI